MSIEIDGLETTLIRHGQFQHTPVPDTVDPDLTASVAVRSSSEKG